LRRDSLGRRSTEDCEEANEGDPEAHSGTEQLDHVNRVNGFKSRVAGQVEEPDASNQDRHEDHRH
jgi:hypothetical protein